MGTSEGWVEMTPAQLGLRLRGALGPGIEAPVKGKEEETRDHSPTSVAALCIRQTGELQFLTCPSTAGMSGESNGNLAAASVARGQLSGSVRSLGHPGLAPVLPH